MNHSLATITFPPIPSAWHTPPSGTLRVKGNLYMQLRDRFGMLYDNQHFAHLFAHAGQPALAPARLALVLIFQFLEDLSDRAAADAVRDRISWKYALGLSLDDPGFHYSVLSEFRQRLLISDAEQLLLDVVLDLCREVGFTPTGYPKLAASNGLTPPLCSLPFAS